MPFVGLNKASVKSEQQPYVSLHNSYLNRVCVKKK